MPVEEKAQPSTITDSLMERLKKEKEVAFKFRERRHEEWNDNYELNRNKIKTNRLTQRQAIGVPLMKETNKTILSRIDDPPNIDFKELDGNLEKELIIQELWNDDADKNNLEGVDIQDKKTVLLYGRGFIKLNYFDKMAKFNALDIYDVSIDPWVNPLDIETARFLIHTNIFKSLREVLASDRYSNSAKRKLKEYLNTSDAIIQSGDIAEKLEEKQERMLDMGVEKTDFDTFTAGDVVLNLTEHYFNFWDKKKKKFIRYVAVYANDEVRLLTKPLKELIGVDFLPFVTWGEDIETQDFWSDGPSDIVRNINKIINVWFSQYIENRTIRNFVMHWFDATIEGYQPQTFEPGAGKMLPAPGDPNKTIKPVATEGLETTLDAIDFLTKLVESSTAATAIQKGVSEKRQITLGEVEILVGKAMERIVTMAKFYRRARKELAEKWYKIRDANTGLSDSTKLYKTSPKGKLIGKKVYGRDWKSSTGYKIIAQSTAEQDAEKTESLKRFLAVRSQFPDNPALNKVIQRRTLDILDLTSDELREIEEFEKKKIEAPQAPVSFPSEEDLGKNIMKGVGELEQLTAQT